jgi:two-component system sensor histidine kinase KdpD
MTRVEKTLGSRKIHIDVPPTLPLAAVDALLVEKLLVNLLENAARYTPPGSPIDVTVTHDEPNIRIAVSDRGPGIPPGEHERIFTKFHRVATATSHTGVGLGLAICRAIAALHDARIWVEDRPGGGATFVVELPSGGEAPRSHADGLPLHPETGARP